eukprot:1739422-Alexandrium_andersonii.AAC.1
MIVDDWFVLVASPEGAQGHYGKGLECWSDAAPLQLLADNVQKGGGVCSRDRTLMLAVVHLPVVAATWLWQGGSVWQLALLVLLPLTFRAITSP